MNENLSLGNLQNFIRIYPKDNIAPYVISGAVDLLHSVINGGLKPHNPDARIATEFLQADINSGIDMTILMLKPGFFSLNDAFETNTILYDVQKDFEKDLTDSNIMTRFTSLRTLSSVEVFRLYEKELNYNEKDETLYGTWWKTEIVEYLSTQPVFSYYLVGENAESKTRQIRNKYRKLFTKDPRTKVVQNIGHIPDPEEFGITFQYLFL